ncbi:hypothetical protein PPTG_22424 [Phytophthora nicotianae INRA-310]|uniref:Uncharacterized protein n=1 Tax=Phytophthora nicotianae (strain INRA-310) TaxID=761204 RepID=W2QI70_PHYN3|nr:hypothetical protein PPTG_22424 [Phytophthora nicotianae INRA-310]ETN12837.1 hypothetical protein PPTG_22424 [Phytophthora nicotianae INRA-310]
MAIAEKCERTVHAWYSYCRATCFKELITVEID